MQKQAQPGYRQRQAGACLEGAAPILHLMGTRTLQDHLCDPNGLGALARSPHTGAAGGAACGDLIRLSVRVEGDRVAEAGFDARGCAAARGAGSAAVDLVAGAPPHGGVAFGLDRIVALLVGRDTIRDVIAFPKTASGMDPLTGAPAPVAAAQLRELGLRRS